MELQPFYGFYLTMRQRRKIITGLIDKGTKGCREKEEFPIILNYFRSKQKSV